MGSCRTGRVPLITARKLVVCGRAARHDRPLSYVPGGPGGFRGPAARPPHRPAEDDDEGRHRDGFSGCVRLRFLPPFLAAADRICATTGRFVRWSQCDNQNSASTSCFGHKTRQVTLHNTGWKRLYSSV
jgi:hypothetical protein